MAKGGVGRAIDLHGRLAKFENTRVLLVGDTIVDLYTYGSAIGIAAETPTIVARREKVSRTLGGAAFVCANLLELGAQVDFITAVGADEEAARVADLASPNLNLIAISDPTRPTTVKHRFWVDGYKLLQLDVRDDSPVGEAVAADVMAAFYAGLERIDAVVVSDYRHGLISPAMAAALVAGARGAGKPVYVDSQVAQNTGNHTDYRSGAIICLNLKEARSIDGAFAPSDRPAAFLGLQARLEARMLILKLGEQGSMIFDGQRVITAPAWPVQVADVTGAGDAFLACLALTGLDDPLEALTLANAWAGLSVQIHGTVPPKLADLAALESHPWLSQPR
jgi:D-beta-D-heptose 7-phosphate kinase/D-beta-D-heptose 1-phosphate adenosyltransferase